MIKKTNMFMIRVHDCNLKKVLDRALKFNAKFNSSKLQYKTAQVTLVGHTISVSDKKHGPKNIGAIVFSATPQKKKDLMRFLGLAKFFSKFTSNLSQRSTNLRELIKMNSTW